MKSSKIGKRFEVSSIFLWLPLLQQIRVFQFKASEQVIKMNPHKKDKTQQLEGYSKVPSQCCCVCWLVKPITREVSGGHYR